MLSEHEKNRILQSEYAPSAHRIGLWTSVAHMFVFFLPPLYLMIFEGLTTDWAAVAKGTVAVLGFSLPLWFIEPISYFMVLGIAGTYISFVAGNISNFRLPVSALAQEATSVQEGSPESEVVAALAVVTTQVMITAATLAGALFITAVIKLLPPPVVAAFDWLLPSIWGAIVVQFSMRKWQYGVAALVISSVAVFSPLPSWSQIPTCVFLMAFLASFLHRRGIWPVNPKS